MKWERFEVRSTPGLRPADYWPKARNLSSQVWLHGNLTGVGDDLVSAGLTPVWQAKLSFLFWEICSTLQCSSFSLTKSQHAYNDQQGHTWPASANPMTSPGTILLFPHSSSAPPASSNTPTFAGGFARPGPLTHSKPCLNVTPSNEAHPATYPLIPQPILLIPHLSFYQWHCSPSNTLHNLLIT